MADETSVTRLDPAHDPAGEVVELCRELIRIDTSNYGDQDGPGERKAAEYVATLLDEVGIESRLVEPEPGRTSVVAHWGGTASDRGALSMRGMPSCFATVPTHSSGWRNWQTR